MPPPPPDLGLVDGLVQLSAIVQATLVETAAAAGLSLLQARLLGVLRDREPTMAELGRILGLDSSSTTGLIDRAGRRGLVRRVRDPRDGRAYRVRLDQAGRELVGAVVPQMTARLAELTDELSTVDRADLSRLASAVVQHHAAARGIELHPTIQEPDP